MMKEEKAEKEFKSLYDKLAVLDADYLVGNISETEYKRKRRQLEKKFIALKNKYKDLF